MAQSIPAPTTAPGFGGRKVLIAALILGAITAGLIVAFLASRDSGTAPEAISTAKVVVAKQDIAPGTKIEASMVELRELPASAVISDPASSTAAVIGQTARYPMLKGEQFSLGRLVEPPQEKSLAFTIPEGLRGFTVPVDVTKSPAALLTPGDFVDIIVSAEIVHLLPPGTVPTTDLDNSDDKPKAAVTLLQNVQVLAVQREFVDDGVPYDASTRGEPIGDDDKVNYVTLAVTPEQAQLLWLASQEGALTLSLRPFGDDAAAALTPIAEPIPLP